MEKFLQIIQNLKIRKIETEIYQIGVRNPQGMALSPFDNKIYLTITVLKVETGLEKQNMVKIMDGKF